MRRVTVLAVVLLGSLAIAPLSAARAQSDGNELGSVLVNANSVSSLLRSRAVKLRTSAGPDPDTVWAAKSFTDHTGPQNYWNIYTGDNRPGTNDPNNAIWDWDNTVGIQAPDSLMGWWPYTREYSITGGLTLTDDQRPWWAVDYGNWGNYVIAQGAAAKRTWGVCGYWHADSGASAASGRGVTWLPIGGSKSAWCGLREHGDLSHVDKMTGNPYNAQVVFGTNEASGGIATNKNLPGYVNQMDQMLYRDIPLTSGQSLTLSFSYRTRMSTSIGTNAATRTGWFDKDPLNVVAGNFISSSAAGTLAPADSFMVYVGSPVNDAAAKCSDGVVRPVYDHQRRWFSEVLRVNEGSSAPYYELLGAAGNNPPDTTGSVAFSVTIPSATVDQILGTAGNPGTIRLVFRVKTNRGFADDDTRSTGYTSGGRGAAVVDDVVANGSTIGDFEADEEGGPNSIDNRDTPFTTAVTNWKSTGKYTSTWFHVENLANLTYNDLCGPPDSPARFCNIHGNVITAGNHDDGEKIADSRYSAWHEAMYGCMSPTIQLAAGSTPNAMGITSTIADATDDIYIWYDMYAGCFNLFFTGDAWWFGAISYPAQQAQNGGICWGDRHYPTFQIFNPEPQCFSDIEGLYQNSQIATSNPSGIPDSLRILMGVNQQCFRFAVSLGCNSAAGAYFDNISLAFVDLPATAQASASNGVTLGGVTTDIWQFVNDTFPANETTGLPGLAAFDTTTALIKTGINTAQNTGTLQRFDIPGDTTIVRAANATVTSPSDPNLARVRVDLVFRILPGPGNYQISAGRSMPPGGVPTGVLLQLPTNQSAVVTPGDASFWGQYISDPGQLSAGTHNGHTSWDPLTWNSARCDTAELDIFPTGGINGTGLVPGTYAAMYHESDPKFATLGIDKFRCFVVDTTKAATDSPTLTNVVCDGTVPVWLTTVPQSRTGYDGSNTTKEFTKIIPDGLLTPGSHVEYFFRKSHDIDPLLEYAMCPDTNLITPQASEGSTDAHRWQEFSVLPDRWKNNAYGGAGTACVLYVDYNDRRGNERVWVAVQDSIAGTAQAKWGAHNGWHAPGNVNINGLDVRTNPSVIVANRNSQPGTTWDMYGVKASESLTTGAGALGSRLANRANMGFAAGKTSRAGPTPEMLRTYYRMIVLLSGDLNSGVLGPFANRSQDDIALLTDFLTNSSGSAQPRGIFVQGDGFGQSESQSAGVVSSHGTFLTNQLGVNFRNASYQSISGNVNDCADLITTTNVTPNGDVYGVQNLCLWSNDVYLRNSALGETQDGSFYENVGVNGPYTAEVVKPANATRNWIALTSGYDVEHLFGRYCDTDMGRLGYYYYSNNRVFGGICQMTGAPLVTLDTPQAPRGSAFVNFMKIGNSVMRQGFSTVHFSVKSPGVVTVGVYDVTGRAIKTLAKRYFAAGEASLTWDGSDDAGNRVARGVYFVRLVAPGARFEDAGRIIVNR